MWPVRLFSQIGVRRACLAIVGAWLLSASGPGAWADDDRDRTKKRTDVHIRLPGIHIDVGRGAPPPPIVESYVIQTRGPVHEAFAGPLVFDPTPGMIVRHRPPEPLDELPPQIAPTGYDVAWIPGYWAFDEEQSAFIWISGLWRNMPPGQQYVPGYWREMRGGYQWVSGFWMPGHIDQIQYLPPPPASLEVEPANVQKVSNRVWVPGVWLWRQTGYQWRPGYWMPAQEHWVWVPDHYVWAPAGCVFVSGFWDHSIPRRGVLFAPIYLPPQVVVARRVTYTPSVVVNVSLLVGNLFARPAYNHYYFGDYYDRVYFRQGIYPAYSFHGSRYGYDPVFAHYVATQRRGRAEIIARQRDDYRYRRDHRDARPPRTYTEWQKVAGRGDINPRLASMIELVQPLARAAETKNAPLRMQSLQPDRINTYRETISKTRDYGEQRRQLESGVTRTPEAPAVTVPEQPAAPARPQPAQPVTPQPRPQPVRPETKAEPVKPAPERPQPAPGVSIPRKPEAQPARPAGPQVQRETKPLQLRLQKSPLSGRPLNQVERKAAPPSAPKAAAPAEARKGVTRGPAATRPEPRD